MLNPRPTFGRLALAATLLGLLVAIVLPAGAANAAAYRYWGYFQWDGTQWAFAQKGPDQLKPADGSVEGWRFAVSGEDSTRFPRVEKVSFEEICGDTEAEAGKKRVAVVLDFGRVADTEDGSTPPEPEGRCAQVPAEATALDVLGSVADVRSDKSLICGIDGHPAKGCGDEVKTVSAEAEATDEPVELKAAAEAETEPASAETDEGTGTGTWIGIGVAVLAALALGAVALLRRRSA